MSLQSTLSVAADGYLCPGPFLPLSIASRGHLCFVVVTEDAADRAYGTWGSIRAPEEWDDMLQARLLRDDDDALAIFMMSAVYGLMEQ